MDVLPDEYLPDDYTGPSAGSIQQIVGTHTVTLTTRLEVCERASCYLLKMVIIKTKLASISLCCRPICIEFADKILIFALLKRLLLQQRELEKLKPVCGFFL